MLPASHHIYTAISAVRDEELARAAERQHKLQPRSRRFFRRPATRGLHLALTPRQA
jgi:hypothetical protein